MEGEKIRIKLKSYDHRLLDKAVEEIVQTIKRTGAQVKGPVPLPVKIEKYTVNRSTFVHKKSMEQFEIRIHSRLIDIWNPQEETINALTSLHLPAGVYVDVKS